jgi:hypothetical protein
LKLVLATHDFDYVGGSETYLLTVAKALERLGHEVVIYALRVGAMADFATGQGINVARCGADLPSDCDALIVQDGAVSYLLTDRFPERPQLFVAHSEEIVLQRPPQLPGVVAGAVVLNDRVALQLEAGGVELEMFRMRQPIDNDRFQSRGAIRERPARILLLGNRLSGRARELVEEAVAGLSLEVRQVGIHGEPSVTPEAAIADADVVVGYGRCIVEAMACRRAAYVFDAQGGDGWVTADSYPAMEADGFAGRATDKVIDAARMHSDFGGYDHRMGTVNFQLASRYHRMIPHAAELATILRRFAPPQRDGATPLDELARLVRMQWQTAARAESLSRENRDLRVELESVRKELYARRRFRLGARFRQSARLLHR